MGTAIRGMSVALVIAVAAQLSPGTTPVEAQAREFVQMLVAERFACVPALMDSTMNRAILRRACLAA